MKHTMRLNASAFEKIKSGEKIFEIRINDEKRQNVKAGDLIVFYRMPNLDRTILTYVCETQKFASFKEMASTLDKKEIGFENQSEQEIADAYLKNYYSKDEEEKFGVLAIKVKVL